MEVHLIYDDRRFERLQPLRAELHRQHLDPDKIWTPKMLPSVVESINDAHKTIVRYAMEKELKEVCIMEDDVMFPAIDGFRYFVRNKPKKYDMYFAGTYLPFQKGEQLCKINGAVGFHCYIIHEKFYEMFLSVPSNKHIDTAMDGLGDYYVCYPMAALQRPGFSSNNNAEANYNVGLSKEDVYGW